MTDRNKVIELLRQGNPEAARVVDHISKITQICEEVEAPMSFFRKAKWWVVKKALGHDLEKAVEENAIKPMLAKAEALVNTVPSLTGLINSDYSRSKYKATVQVSGLQISITPEPNTLADWMENGMSSFNVASRMLSSGKTKMSKDGDRYIDVPLNSADGEGSPGSVVRPKRNYSDMLHGVPQEVANRLKASMGEEFSRLHTEDTIQMTRDITQAVMRRVGDVSHNQHQDRVVKIRRISERSHVTRWEGRERFLHHSQREWQHPGFNKSQVLKIIEEEVNKRLAQLVREWG